ncbi:ornithine cyclodeaminase family protein (plasmid) [Arthrobacter sp. UC242_113]|uniref:ornithine cyclodeaminase family protein n=1 Tax=Arthrobacter sp. UC242_113 TaxID=3374550 RepID=UPI0037581C78
MTLYLNDHDVDSLLSQDDAFQCVDKAFRLLAEGSAINVPRQRTAMQKAVLNVMWALAPTEGTMGVKAYPVVRSDVTQGAVLTLLVYAFESGELLGVIKADRLGQLRTGAASAVATRSLARADSTVLAIYGTGFQAETQAMALAKELPALQTIHVVGRSQHRRDAFVARLRRDLGLQVLVSDPESAARLAHVICTATGSTEPVLRGDWLQPGTHINAVGSNTITKREIDRTVLERASLITVDDKAVSLAEGGDFIANGWDQSPVVPLGDVLTLQQEGRQSPDEITLFESHGLALQDLICATMVLGKAQHDRAKSSSLGYSLSPTKTQCPSDQARSK